MSDYPYRFTRKPCVIGGTTSPGDWEIRCDGEVVGRVCPVGNRPDIISWSTCVYPMEGGRCESEQEALEAIKAAVKKLPRPFHYPGRRHAMDMG